VGRHYRQNDDVTEPVNPKPDPPRKSRWWDDARAILAILAVVGAFVLQGAMVVADLGATRAGEVRSIPTWTAATVSAIVGFYFGARGGSNGNGH